MAYSSHNQQATLTAFDLQVFDTQNSAEKLELCQISVMYSQ